MTKKIGRWAKKNQRKKQASYKEIIRRRLIQCFENGLGRSRKEDKKIGADKDRIYSQNTFKTYKKHFRYFSNWLDEKNLGKLTKLEAQEYINDYLMYIINKGWSADSISTAKSALVKAFKIDSTKLIETPKRERKNIKRSRHKTERDKHISKKKLDELSRFTAATGLRRREMLRIRADHLFFENGEAYLRVPSEAGPKAGKYRKTKIVGRTEQETKDIVKWIQSRKGRLFPKLHSHYDNHYYRGIYAKRLYYKIARDESKIPQKEKYIMRKDRAGEVLDRVAMLTVSRNLGHNRIDVIARNYLYHTDDN